MNGLGLTKQLESDIDSNLAELKNAIWKHQTWIAKRKQDPYNFDLQKEVKRAEEEIVFIGLTQKSLLAKLREEYKSYQKTLKCNLIKNGIEEKRFNLTNALNRARKQNIVVRSTTGSFSDDSPEGLSDAACAPEAEPPALPPSPVVVAPATPLRPWDLTQEQFLGRLGLVTHDVYKEMQNRRVERKRRSTANPHFLYGGRGYDYPSHGKRKRNAFLLSPPSPPHTRQAVRRRQEKALAATATTTPSSPPPPDSGKRGLLSTFPSIPNLPSGLIIERVGPGEIGGASPDSKTCVTCKQTGALTVCDVCANGFHVSCHNRPLTHAPHQCPRCIQRETRTVGSLNVPSGMSVSYVTADLSEKLSQKRDLEERKRLLCTELAELESRHSTLSISLNDQKTRQEELVTTQRSAEGKIRQILSFIESVQRQRGGDGDEGDADGQEP